MRGDQPGRREDGDRARGAGLHIEEESQGWPLGSHLGKKSVNHNHCHHDKVIHLLGNASCQLVGEVAVELPLTTTWLRASLATKLVAPIGAIKIAVTAERLIDTTTAKPTLEVSCPAKATFLVFPVSTILGSVAGSHFGDAPSFPAEELFVVAESVAGNLVLAVAAIRGAVAFPGGGDAAALGAGDDHYCHHYHH